MGIEHSLARAAAHLAAEQHERQGDLSNRVLDAMETIQRLNAEIARTREAMKRLPTFRHSIEGKPQCPRCWIVDGVHSDLTADLECDTCGKDFG